ncbi:MAG: hypothetical protein MUE51_11520 [Thermoleophilia bacterium]|nr:hypothetical protein [Thermoleophilia bacterium]
MARDDLLRLAGTPLVVAAVGGGLLLQGAPGAVALAGGAIAGVLPLAAMRRRRPGAPDADDPTAIEEIDRLRRRGWRVVHAAPTPQGTVRHALIGPGGALAAVTHGQSGRVSGRSLPRRRLAAVEADRVRLESAVGPPAGAIVVVGRGFMPGPERVAGVDVVPVRSLADHLAARGEVMGADEVEEAWRAVAGAG